VNVTLESQSSRNEEQKNTLPVNRSGGIGGRGGDRGGGCNAADRVGLMGWKMSTKDSAELVNPSKFTSSLMSEIS
jgi:hypothetical protein